jgi:lambda family phage minor tail protein L
MSVNSAVFSNLQSINPSAIIELFTLQLSTALHGANTIYRFHAGSNLDANGQIVWAGNSYLRFPIQASGFAFQKGQLPRPKISISNKAVGTNAVGLISAILLSVNETTAGNDLTGATVTRIRTLAKFLDAVNFPNRDNSGNPVNPLGTPDPNAEFPKEIYAIDRKSTETREVVEFELAAPTDLAGVRIPKRQCTRSIFPSIGTFVG